jgi:hypothetical protein
MTLAYFPLRMGAFLGMTEVNECNSWRVVDGRWLVYLSRLGRTLRAVNTSESLLAVQWEYNWIDEIDSD